MAETLKIAIPMAGLGTRLRPHTWSKPKSLVALAGRTVLDYVLDMFKTVPDPGAVEYIFITSQMGDQVKDYMRCHYPDLNVHYVVQSEMRGQSDALYLAREYLTGPMIMAFADTLIETDFSFLAKETSDGVAWVKQVPDPRRFGVAVADSEGWISRLIEKPKEMDNDLAVVGFYYFRRGEALVSAIEEQMARKITLKNEFFLADAINIMLEHGAKMRTHRVNTWLDAGTTDSLLETNRYLLEHGRDNSEQAHAKNEAVVIPPVFIHPDARVSGSVIGPNVSIGPDCNIQSSIIRNSILEEGVEVTNSLLENSMLGRNVEVTGQPLHLNLGDQSWATR